MILTLRTDKPLAELHLYTPAGVRRAQHSWTADRQLADTLLPAIEDFLRREQVKLNELTGLVVFSGEGSFTGLRIGTTVANAMAYSLNIPVVKAGGAGWQAAGLKLLRQASPGLPVTPDYSAEPNITKPKSD